MQSLVFAQHPQAALELVAGARALGAQQVTLVVISTDGSTPDFAPLVGVDLIAQLNLKNCSPVPEHRTPPEAAVDSLTAYLEAVKPNLILAEPGRTAKILVGSLAARLKTSLICNVTGLSRIDDGRFNVSVQYYGGLAEQSLTVTATPACFSVGSGVFAEDQATGKPAADPGFVEIPWIDPVRTDARIIFEKEVSHAAVDLSKSQIVIGCGRGFREKTELDLAESLAKQLNAGLACTRPLAETEAWFSHSQYLGVSGQTIKPRVYLAVGISGQMQHMIGVNKAGSIIAVNKDKDSPIFRQCDLGIVGDLHTVLPALQAQFEG